jgi:cell division protein FtsB
MDFYRRLSTSIYKAGPVARLLKSKKALAAVLLIGAVAGYVVFGSHGILQRIRLQRQSAELTRKLIDAEEEARDLEVQSRALDTNKKAIEKVARERYGMARPGETVYKVKKDGK